MAIPDAENPAKGVVVCDVCCSMGGPFGADQIGHTIVCHDCLADSKIHGERIGDIKAAIVEGFISCYRIAGFHRAVLWSCALDEWGHDFILFAERIAFHAHAIERQAPRQY